MVPRPMNAAMVLLDIDRVPALMRVSAVTSDNRWNWASFDDRDHLGDPSRPLRERLIVDAARHGVELPAGPIFLLTHLRYLGYCFNPVSFFYCFDPAERLQVVLAEVSNTFGGTHNYWLRPDSALRTFRAAAVKSLYVSPFMTVPMGMPSTSESSWYDKPSSSRRTSSSRNRPDKRRSARSINATSSICINRASGSSAS